MKATLSLLHDLNNKVSIALGNLHVALRGDIDDVLKKRLDVTQLALNRSVELIKVLQGLHNHGNKDLNVDMALQSSEELFTTLSKMYGVTFSWDLHSVKEGIDIDIDQAAMFRVVENIIENAAKAGATKLNIADRIHGNKLVSTFTDNGKGCKEEDLPKIATGWTTNGTGKGTQIIKELMQAMGGDASWSCNTEGGMVVTLVTNISKKKAVG